MINESNLLINVSKKLCEEWDLEKNKDIISLNKATKGSVKKEWIIDVI